MQPSRIPRTRSCGDDAPVHEKWRTPRTRFQNFSKDHLCVSLSHGVYFRNIYVPWSHTLSVPSSRTLQITKANSHFDPQTIPHHDSANFGIQGHVIVVSGGTLSHSCMHASMHACMHVCMHACMHAMPCHAMLCHAMPCHGQEHTY